MGHILKMKPILHEKIWGGKSLETFNYTLPSDKTGEAWCISAHKNGDCEIENTEFKNMTLSKLYNEHRELFGNIESDEFPLLIKIIDAKDDLSVQVHPDDKYAKENENSLGKTECWFVLDAKDNTQMVLGHHARTKEEFIDAINNDKYDGLLNKFTINKGDFFYIPSGTLHAICSGSLIYEAQQSSDITYRVYDYHRKDDNGNERELHVKQSIDVTTIPSTNSNEHFYMVEKLDTGSKINYLKCDYLSVYGYIINSKNIVKHNVPFSLVSVIEGEGFINDIEVKKGDHYIICSDVETIVYDGAMKLMVTTL